MDNIIEKFEIANIDKFIKYLSYNSFMKILLDKVKDSFILSFNNTNEEYGFKIDVKVDPRAIENLRTREFILSQKTIENLRGNLRYELLSGMEANESIDMITRRVSKIFVSNSVNIERICRTEVLHSLNSGRMEAYRSSKVVKYKMVIGTNDKRLCALCRRMRGQIKPISEPFQDPKNLDESWMHPPFHPSGRCSTIPLRRLPDNVITTSGQMYAADKKLGKVEIPIDLLKFQYKNDNKVEIPTESLNKKEIPVKGFTDKKGNYHKPHKRMIKISNKKETSKIKKSVMTPNNIDKIESFETLGVAGGMHYEDTYMASFKDGSRGIYKVLNELGRLGEISNYTISNILGFNKTPETTNGNFGKGHGSCQKWIPDTVEFTSFKFLIPNKIKMENKYFKDLSKIVVCDMVTGSNDRHEGNIIIKDDECFAIDNEDWGQDGIADFIMETLDYLCGNDNDDGRILQARTPIFRWVMKDLSVDDYKLFREYLIDNMKNVVDNKEKLIEYYNNHSKHEDINVQRKANNNKNNINWIVNFYNKNKG